MFTLDASDPRGIHTITLARPPANAMSYDDIAELEAVLARARAASDCRALVFQASGRFFSAGADIKTMRGTPGDAAHTERLIDLARRMQAAFAAIEQFPAPTIAAIQGIATGGGLELALACDLRIASTGGRLGLTETRIGLIPGAGGTQRLTRVAGRAVALRLILGGELIDGAEAARLGVVHEAVAQESVASRAFDLAAQLAALPRGALQAAKRCIALASSPAGYAAEIEETARLHASEETRAAIGAFLNRAR